MDGWVGLGMDGRYGYYNYTVIKTLMERESWDCAMRFVVILYEAIYYWNNYEDGRGWDTMQSQWGDENGNNIIKPGFFEIIVSNMKDFDFKDEKGTKLLDLMFEKYLEESLGLIKICCMKCCLGMQMRVQAAVKCP